MQPNYTQQVIVAPLFCKAKINGNPKAHMYTPPGYFGNVRDLILPIYPFALILAFYIGARLSSALCAF
jgi:hypothetical protein